MQQDNGRGNPFFNRHYYVNSRNFCHVWLWGAIMSSILNRADNMRLALSIRLANTKWEPQLEMRDTF
jgi:hypothetical protein